ncbi:MAG: hypothetical protein LQ342_004264 [Letrouitia transgressa]|nr:MAG: hypothetical protein LQ342_004264 [Letrouitia transgressa]
MRLFNPRMLLMCQYRCYCNGYNPGVTKGPFPGLENFYDEVQNPYLIVPDIVQDFDEDPPDEISNPIHEEETLYYHIFQLHYSEAVFRVRRGVGQHLPDIRDAMMHENSWEEVQLVTPEESKVVFCGGPMPNFPLPAPMTAEDFAHPNVPAVERLCASAIDAGNPQANAGGFCSALPTRELQFSDTLTPRWDWTITGPNILAALAIRRHCYLHCECVDTAAATATVSSATATPTSGRPGTGESTNVKRTYPIDEVYEVGPEEPDRSVKLRNRVDGRIYINVLPPWMFQPNEGGVDNPAEVREPEDQQLRPAGTCGPDSKQFCPQSWDPAWGPLPMGPDLNQKRPPPTSLRPNDLTQCGNKCGRMSDCQPSDNEKKCYCAIPSMADIRALGLDPVFPPGPICLAILLAASMNDGRPNGKRDRTATALLERGAQSPLLNAEGELLQCLCNTTYISPDCCWAEDGLV